VAIIFNSDVSLISHGIWGGIIFIVAGSLGVSAAKSPTACHIMAFMVLCIISACVSAVVISMGVFGDFVSLLLYNCGDPRNGPNYDMTRCQSIFNIRIAMNSLIAILGLIGGIAAIWGSVICCKVWCCCRNYRGNTAPAPMQFMSMPGNQKCNCGPQKQMSSAPFQQQPFQGQIHSTYSQGYSHQSVINTAAAAPYQACSKGSCSPYQACSKGSCSPYQACSKVTCSPYQA